jgi:DNA-binding transcriptional regulator LsrR (DeoR family)
VVLGNRKASAVEAALRTGMITDLVVDATVAHELLAMARATAPTPAVDTAS